MTKKVQSNPRKVRKNFVPRGKKSATQRAFEEEYGLKNGSRLGFQSLSPAAVRVFKVTGGKTPRKTQENSMSVNSPAYTRSRKRRLESLESETEIAEQSEKSPPQKVKKAKMAGNSQAENASGVEKGQKAVAGKSLEDKRNELRQMYRDAGKLMKLQLLEMQWETEDKNKETMLKLEQGQKLLEKKVDDYQKEMNSRVGDLETTVRRDRTQFRPSLSSTPAVTETVKDTKASSVEVIEETTEKSGVDDDEERSESGEKSDSGDSSDESESDESTASEEDSDAEQEKPEKKPQKKTPDKKKKDASVLAVKKGVKSATKKKSSKNSEKNDEDEVCGDMPKSEMVQLMKKTFVEMQISMEMSRFKVIVKGIPEQKRNNKGLKEQTRLCYERLKKLYKQLKLSDIDKTITFSKNYAETPKPIEVLFYDARVAEKIITAREKDRKNNKDVLSSNSREIREHNQKKYQEAVTKNLQLPPDQQVVPAGWHGILTRLVPKKAGLDKSLKEDPPAKKGREKKDVSSKVKNSKKAEAAKKKKEEKKKNSEPAETSTTNTTDSKKTSEPTASTSKNASKLASKQTTNSKKRKIAESDEEEEEKTPEETAPAEGMEVDPKDPSDLKSPKVKLSEID